MPSMMVPAGYSHAVVEAGGLPVMIPPFAGTPQLLDRLDGLIFSGGSDLAAELYGQTQHPDTLGVIPHRDRSELELLGEALERDLPVLGICRGMQLVNVIRGGSLHQHLPELVDGSLHKAAPGTFATHDVAIEPGSRLSQLLGARVQVHSCHHQAPDRIGRGLAVTARAPDGIVEGIELDAPASRWACSGTPRSTPSWAGHCSGRWSRQAPRPSPSWAGSAPDRAGGFPTRPSARTVVIWDGSG